MPQKTELPSLEMVLEADYAELTVLYKQVMKTSPPPRTSPMFLRGNIVWTIQAIQADHDPKALRKSLLDDLARASRKKYPVYLPGTRLIREWQGQVHEVEILEKGYLWRGEHYQSLSRIAYAITGVKWSGPRFFGLKEITR